MNEMIQEAVLDSIESIDEAQLFAEFDVLMSMADVYSKAAMIQEASGLDFDGYSVIQEADEPAVADEPGVDVKRRGATYSTKKPGALKKIWGYIKKAFEAIGTAFAWIWNKITSIFKKKDKIPVQQALAIGTNGGKVELTTTVAEKIGVRPDCLMLGMKEAKEDVAKVEEAVQKNGGELPVSWFKALTPVIHYNPRALEKACKFSWEAYEKYKDAIANFHHNFKMNKNARDYFTPFNNALKEALALNKQAAGLLHGKENGGVGAGSYNHSGYVSNIDYSEILTSMINVKETAKKIKDSLTEIKKGFTDIENMSTNADVFDLDGNQINTIRDSIGPFLATSKEIMHQATELFKEVSPTTVKARASKKMDDFDYEADADARFGANAEFP